MESEMIDAYELGRLSGLYGIYVHPHDTAVKLNPRASHAALDRWAERFRQGRADYRAEPGADLRTREARERVLDQLAELMAAEGVTTAEGIGRLVARTRFPRWAWAMSERFGPADLAGRTQWHGEFRQGWRAESGPVEYVDWLAGDGFRALCQLAGLESGRRTSAPGGLNDAD